MQKQSNIVTPVGNFIVNLVTEFARRMISNGERISTLLEEAKERFPDMTNQDIYTLLAELSKLGFDIEPNEWLFNTPIENRAEVLNKYLVKTGKSYGSREEDIKACIQEKENYIKEIDNWLKENKDASRLYPQTYEHYMSVKRSLEQAIKDLKKLLNLTKSGSLLYIRGYFTPVNFIGINEDDKIYGIVHTASGDLIKVSVDELSDKSDLDIAKELDKENENGITLYKEFELLARAGDPLKTFFNTFDEGYTPSTKEGLEEYITNFLNHIDNEKEAYVESKTFTQEQINDAIKKIKEFVNAKDLNVNVDMYIDKSLEIGKKEETLEGQIPKEEENKQQPITTSSALKIEKKIAEALSNLNKIEKFINSIQTSKTINRTVAMEDSMNDILKKISDLKFYIREELINEPELEKEASYVILAHIIKDLEKAKNYYEELHVLNDKDVEYVAATILEKQLKKANMMLSTILK